MNFFMKHICTIFLLTYSICSHSQYVYKSLVDDLKDLIVFESLLAENRYNELAQYRKDKGYTYLNEESKNVYFKFDNMMDFIDGKSNYSCTFTFEKNVNIENLSPWKVTLLFQFRKSKYDDMTNIFTKKESDILKGIIYSELEVGLAWGMYKAFINSEKEISEKIITISDREFKFYNDVEKSYDTYKLSNFTGNSPHINSGLVYFGPPSKYSWLEFGFLPIETPDGLMCSFYSIAYLGEPEDRKKKKNNFKISDITSYENLNEVIWQKLIYKD